MVTVYSYIYGGPTSITIPAGVTHVDVYVWGGSGGGGGGAQYYGGGGVAATGTYSGNVAVTAGDTYNFTIGTGGAGGNSAGSYGTAGGATTITIKGTPITNAGGAGGTGGASVNGNGLQNGGAGSNPHGLIGLKGDDGKYGASCTSTNVGGNPGSNAGGGGGGGGNASSACAAGAGGRGGDGAVQVSWDLPVSTFTAVPTAGTYPLVSQFTGSAGTSYLWSWGDGSADGTTQSPEKTYASPGRYDVTHTVTNAYGSTQTTVIGYINVYKPQRHQAYVICNESLRNV